MLALPPLPQDAQQLCQALLRIDTTNPTAVERPAAELLQRAFAEVGLSCELLEAAPGRTNLVTRLRGSGRLPPLLLTAHLDVVEADPSQWKYPPFSGQEAEGCLWGRGAIDMKNMAAMCTAMLRDFARRGVKLDRDLIFAAVADEEAGCDLGSRYLVEHHRHLIEAEYAIGESGGFSLHLGDTTFYPVQVAEKGFCWVRATVRGEPGHGSMPRADSAVIRLGQAIDRLGRTPLPTHATSYVRDFVAALASRQPKLVQPLVRLLGTPSIAGRITALRPDLSFARGFGALLRNTAAPTVVRAGAKTNVIPGVAEMEIDGRILPGQTDADFLRELGAVLGPDVELEVIKSAPPIVTEPIASPLFSIIEAEILRREPTSTVVPYMIPGFTDAKYFTQMGAKWYGFSPVKIERGAGMRFADMFHGHNERIPVAGLHWGTELLSAVVERFATAPK